MDAQRAQAIIQSEQTIHVECDGQSVWIDRVNEDGSTARVHPENHPADSRVVALTELEEVGKRKDRGLNGLAVYS